MVLVHKENVLGLHAREQISSLEEFFDLVKLDGTEGLVPALFAVFVPITLFWESCVLLESSATKTPALPIWHSFRHSFWQITGESLTSMLFDLLHS